MTTETPAPPTHVTRSTPVEAKFVLTDTAAKGMQELAPALRSAVAEFLATQFPDYAKTHAPQPLEGLQHKYWIVAPRGAGGAVRLMITKRSQDETTGGLPEFVVAGVLTHNVIAPDWSEPTAAPRPRDVSLGAMIASSTQYV